MVDTEGETDPMAIAEKELAQKQIPFIIRFSSCSLVSSVVLDVFCLMVRTKTGGLMN